ncbi:MAG TPA: acyltransferase [Burkholderiaceae bacterium]|nr:acyltransferase [Burkholderiaceae bacterium]
MTRNFGLDAMRALAILLVLVAHGTGEFLSKWIPRFWSDFSGLLGFWGVEIFFALSGFLVGGILIKISTDGLTPAKIGRFWFMRWMRTLPNYYVYLLGQAWLIVPLSDLPRIIWDNKAFLVFFQSFAWPHPGFFDSGWSLAVEEWFYFITPLILYVFVLLRGKPRTSQLLTILLVFAFSVILRAYVSLQYPQFGFDAPRKIVIFRFDGIMYGMAMAYYFHWYKESFNRYRAQFAAVGMLIFIGMFLYQFYGYVDIDTSATFKIYVIAAAPFASALLIPWVTSIPRMDSAVGRWIDLTAKLSYSLYLCNHMVMVYVAASLRLSIDQTRSGGVMGLFVFISFSYIVAFVSYSLVERPFLTLRDRIVARQKT